MTFTGDTVQHAQSEEYAYLCELLAPLEAPLYPVPGNRDDKAAMRDAFSDCPDLRRSGEFFHYVVDRYDVRLVGIESALASERRITRPLQTFKEY